METKFFTKVVPIDRDHNSMDTNTKLCPLAAFPENLDQWKKKLSFCLSGTNGRRKFGYMDCNGKIYLARIVETDLPAPAIVNYLRLRRSQSTTNKVEHKYKEKNMALIQIGKANSDDFEYDFSDYVPDNLIENCNIILIDTKQLFQLPFPININKTSNEWIITQEKFEYLRNLWINRIQLAKKGDWKSFLKKNKNSMLRICRTMFLV